MKRHCLHCLKKIKEGITEEEIVERYFIRYSLGFDVSDELTKLVQAYLKKKEEEKE